MKYFVIFIFYFLIEIDGFEEFAKPLELSKPRSDGIYEFELVIQEKLTMSTDGQNGAVQVLDYDPDDFETMPWRVRESDQAKPCELSYTWNSSFHNLSTLLQLHGLHQVVFAINGKIPADPIVVPFGAEVILKVFNNLLSESVTVHLHGMDKKGLWYTDGVAFLQQCPIAPKTKYEYRFIADTPGTHWLHGHLGMDRGRGLLGAFIVKSTSLQNTVSQVETLREYPMVLQEWTVADSNYIWYAQRWRTHKWHWGFDLEKLGRCWAPTRTYDFGAIGGVVAIRTLLVNSHGWHDQTQMTNQPQTLPLETFKIKKSLRLQCKPVTICSAIIYFYRLSIKYPGKVKTYDKYQIARACICAAGAREGDTVHTSAVDVLNVSHNILYPDGIMLNIDEERKAKRMEQFDEIRKILSSPTWHFTGAPKVHAQLAVYLNTLRDWQPRLFQEYEMEKLCTMVVQDMYVCPSFIWESDGCLIAVLAIRFVLKLIAPEIKTEDFVKNICARVSRHELRKYRKFVKENVYMI